MTELRRVTAGVLLAFLVMALAATYWGVIRGDDLLRRVDNPRLVEAERVLQRGRIYDEHGMLLAETTTDYNGRGLRRLYPHPEAASAVGYYSLRYGTAGIETSYDALLRGEIGPGPLDTALRRLLHQPAVGGDVRLTLNLQVQQTAVQALGNRNGAAVVITVPDGGVRALASTPSYDPNFLDEDWSVLIQSPDAPLLNRVTQGLYQPGGVLQTVLLAALLAERGPTDRILPTATETVSVNGLELSCGIAAPRAGLTLPEAYQYGCPGAFARLTTLLETNRIDGALWRYGLLTPTELLGLGTATADSPMPLSLQESREAVIASLVGQGPLAVTPLQVLELVAAIANNGNAPLFRLVDAIRLPGEDAWQSVPSSGLSRALLTRENARLMQSYMAAAVADGVAAAAQGASSYPILGHAATAYAGPEARPLQWFTGMIVFPNGAAVVAVVVLEDTPAVDEAARAGGLLLDTAARIYGPSSPARR